MGNPLIDLIINGCGDCEGCPGEKTLHLLKTAVSTMSLELCDINTGLNNARSLDETKLSKSQLKTLHHALQLLLLQDTSRIEEFYPVFNKLDKMILS